MKVEQRRLSELRPYERNPRRNAAAVGAVAASIRRFGFRQPIVIDLDAASRRRWAVIRPVGGAQEPDETRRALPSR